MATKFWAVSFPDCLQIQNVTQNEARTFEPVKLPSPVQAPIGTDQDLDIVMIYSPMVL